MKNSLVYYDVETTGLDPKTAGIVQISMMFEKNGEVVDVYDSMIDCSKYTRDVSIAQKALDINGVKLEEISTFPSPQQVVAEIGAKLMKNYKDNKVKLCGFNNTSFDKYFLQELYNQTDYDYDIFYHYKQIDVFEALKALQYLGLMKATWNQRLVTFIEGYGLDTVDNIEKKAHNSLYDVQMTRELFYYIKKELKCS